MRQQTHRNGLCLPFAYPIALLYALLLTQNIVLWVHRHAFVLHIIMYIKCTDRSYKRRIQIYSNAETYVRSIVCTMYDDLLCKCNRPFFLYIFRFTKEIQRQWLNINANAVYFLFLWMCVLWAHIKFSLSHSLRLCMVVTLCASTISVCGLWKEKRTAKWLCT